MEIREETHGDVLVLVPTGDMDSSLLPKYEGKVQNHLDEGVRAIVWDLGQVGILPSAGVGLLIQTGRRLQASGGVMALANAGSLAKATLRTLGVLDVFHLFNDRASAIRDVEERSKAAGKPPTD